MSPPPAIETHELSKRYEAGGVEALRDVTFAVDEGEIFGFLGRNGAGKSTTVRILTTLLRPTSGWARVAGIDVTADPGAVRRSLGVALQEAALDELMTGQEHLVLAARLIGLDRRAAAARADELLAVFGLTGAADRIAARYSGGMRRRLDVAMALVRNPAVLFLDEPTTGLDPQSRRALWELIRTTRERGTTVFLTTQYLAEADALSDRVAIVHDGRVGAVGSPAALKDRYGTTTVRVRVASGSIDGLAADEDGWVSLDVPGGDPALPGVLARVTGSGAVIERLAVEHPSLEDVFVSLTGAELESGVGESGNGSLSAVRRGIGIVAGSHS